MPLLKCSTRNASHVAETMREDVDRYLVQKAVTRLLWNNLDAIHLRMLTDGDYSIDERWPDAKKRQNSDDRGFVTTAAGIPLMTEEARTRFAEDSIRRLTHLAWNTRNGCPGVLANRRLHDAEVALVDKVLDVCGSEVTSNAMSMTEFRDCVRATVALVTKRNGYRAPNLPVGAMCGPASRGW